MTIAPTAVVYDGTQLGEGVTIGDHAVVAAGSLVREDVEPYTVVAGRPAKVVKKIARPA